MRSVLMHGLLWGTLGLTGPTLAQTAGDVLGPAGVVPLTAPQLQARIVIDPPLAEPLSRGFVFIQYRAENLRIQPVFGRRATGPMPTGSRHRHPPNAQNPAAHPNPAVMKRALSNRLQSPD
ncbi:DUF6130 family protein [Roseomonas sp. KE2513]|uniref:DUF6130 family protein n=1 Tax=Roseomonas sp. KE2513 TaxID=2479202 RepID=UPI0028165420|nr:DUF6130 family protein [Roseomonas sp. KE2513]